MSTDARAALYPFVRQLWVRNVSVVPVPNGKKRPEIKWAQFQHEPPALEHVDLWFHPVGGVPLDTSYAIITGAVSNLVAVDIDSAEAEAWSLVNLPPTPWMTRTRKGHHRYYQHPPGVSIGNKVKMATGDKMIDLDIRGDGGLCIGPYSVHETGFVYMPMGDWTVSPADLPVFDPKWLPTLVRPSLPPYDPSRGRLSTPSRGDSIDVVDRAMRYTEAMGPAIQGQGGDDHTFRVAASLVVEWDLPDAEALAVLRKWNLACVPPWSDDDLASKVASARKSGKGQRGRLREAMLERLPATPEDLVMIGEARTMLAHQEYLERNGGAAVKIEPAPTSVVPSQAPPASAKRPALSEPSDYPPGDDWTKKPHIVGPLPGRRKYCEEVHIGWTGGDKGFSSAPWSCDAWACERCAKRHVVGWLVHMQVILKNFSGGSLYGTVSVDEEASMHRVREAMTRAADTGIDVQNLRVQREDHFDGGTQRRMCYLSTWAPIASKRGRPPTSPGPVWIELPTPSDQYRFLRETMLALPGPVRVWAWTPHCQRPKSDPRNRPLPAWRRPEKDPVDSQRHVVLGTKQRLDKCQHEAAREIEREHGVRHTVGDPWQGGMDAVKIKWERRVVQLVRSSSTHGLFRLTDIDLDILRQATEMICAV